MQPAEIQQALLTQHGLRVDSRMAEYVVAMLEQRSTTVPVTVPVTIPVMIPVIGGDGRTGAPIRILIDPQILSAALNASRANP